MKFNVPSSPYIKIGIYTITSSVDDRFYIGSTINFWRRFSDHKNSLKKKKHANKYLQAFSNKYGIETLSFNLLYLCKEDCLVKNEKYWIETLKPKFNIKNIINRRYSDDEIKYYDNLWIKCLANVPNLLANMNLGCSEKLTEEESSQLPF